MSRVAASKPHLNDFQPALIFDPRLLEMFHELFPIETSYLRVKLYSLSVIFVFARKLLMDRLQPSLFFLVLLDWLDR